jgi:hypothetical protein
VLGSFESHHHVERRSLSGAVGSKQADYLTLRNADTDIVDDASAAVRFLKIVR